MNNNEYKENGFTFVMVLIVILVVGVLVAAFFNSTIFNTRFSAKEIDKSRAYFAAQSGIQHLKTLSMTSIFEDINDEDENVDLPSGSIDTYKNENASYSITLVSEKSLIKNIFMSSGNYNNSKKDLYLIVEDVGLKNFGAFTTRTLSLQGNPSINGDIYVEMTDEETTGFDSYLVDSEGNEIITSDDGFEFGFEIDEFDYTTILKLAEKTLADPENPTINDYDQVITNENYEENFIVNVSENDTIYFDDIIKHGGGTIEFQNTNSADPVNINVFVL